VGDTIQLDATESADSDGHITDYAWDWESDGTYDATWATPVVSHAFATAGSYQVTLRVTDDDSATATTSQTITVTPVATANQPPTARFTWSGSQSGTPRAGDMIRFDAGQSADADGRITAYAWDWESDGAYDSTGANSVVSHAFSAAGSYRVTVRVTDEDGATGTASQTITVTAVPTPTPPMPDGETYALLIAISDYPDYEGNDMHLGEGPQNTIDLMRAVLGGWIDHVMILSESAATRTAILGAIRSFLGQAGPADTVYFHFAGHGASERDTNGDEKDGVDEGIATYNGDDNFGPEDRILDDELLVAFRELRAKRAVLAFESCSSGTMDRSLNAGESGNSSDAPGLAFGGGVLFE
jgi:PKD repeat protein